jgi:hypothetical protein
VLDGLGLLYRELISINDELFVVSDMRSNIRILGKNVEAVLSHTFHLLDLVHFHAIELCVRLFLIPQCFFLVRLA